MIDHIVGRPNPSWKRAQVFLVIFFWLWQILRGNPGAPRLLWLRRANKALKRFTPWQIIVSTLTGVYAVRNLDKILGLGSPEPLARLYSPSYYRATWISTGLDAGFATAISIRPKWLRDICSVLFSIYYIIYANEGDEKLRRFRAVPTVEMLRTTWEKTTNPYIRAFTHLPRITIRRRVLLPRPKTSNYQRPITGYLFFAPPEKQLCTATDLILDFPGGGFVAMSPEHHEERLRMWAISTGRPVLSIDYGKAPEYPYPFAIDEAFDTYRVLVESVGTLIGMSGKKLNIILSGDSAGATIAVNVVFKILEHNSSNPSLLPRPIALVLNYAALDFNFTSWMSPANLRVLRSEQSSGNLPGLKELAAQKDHLQHVSPLSMVGDKPRGTSYGKRLRRRTSWKDAIRGLTSGNEKEKEPERKVPRNRHSTSSVKTQSSVRTSHPGRRDRSLTLVDDRGSLADAESEDEEDFNQWREEDRPIQARVRYVYPHSPSNPVPIPWSESALEQQQEKLSVAIAEANTKATSAIGGKEPGKEAGKEKEPIGTRLTMTSRTGYFQDRIVSPSMMRAMAILYIGPHRNPDFATDFHISPILAPGHILAQFPPLLMQCGEKDPFVDDTVIFAGRVREAKRARKIELDLAISGKSARFGEGLRMSVAEASGLTDSGRFAAMKKERDQLAEESEDDWVQMVLFSDWSHGYLQMPSLMSEAKAVIEELAEWIDGAFEKYTGQGGGEVRHVADTGRGNNTTRHTPPVSLQAPGAVHSTSTASETETDDSVITFVPKKYQAHSHSGSMDSDHPLTSSPDSDANFTQRVDFSGSDATLLDGGRDHRDMLADISNSDHDHHAPDAVNTTRHGSDTKVVPVEDVIRISTSDAGTPNKQVVPRQAGQTITETELMRRRRLLDSHIFE